MSQCEYCFGEILMGMIHYCPAIQRIAQLEAENARLTALDEHSRLAFRGQQEQLETLVKENDALATQLQEVRGKNAELGIALVESLDKEQALATRCGEMEAQRSWVHAVACGEEQIADDDTDALRLIFEALDAAIKQAEPSTPK